MDKEYEAYVKKLKESANKIDMKYVTKRRRGGKAGIIDKIVFLRASFTQAEHWIKFPYQFVFWTSLTPMALANLNEFLKWLGVPFFIPLSWGSVVALGVIFGLFILGILSYTHLGVVKSNQELGGIQQSPLFALFREIQELKQEVQELKGEKNE